MHDYNLEKVTNILFMNTIYFFNLNCLFSKPHKYPVTRDECVFKYATTKGEQRTDIWNFEHQVYD